MTSLLGFGLIDTDQLMNIWSSSRDKVISRGLSMALMPILEEIIKNRLSNIGFIKRYK
jgi:hypothetical protein